MNPKPDKTVSFQLKPLQIPKRSNSNPHIRTLSSASIRTDRTNNENSHLFEDRTEEIYQNHLNSIFSLMTFVDIIRI